MFFFFDKEGSGCGAGRLEVLARPEMKI